jgi:hypothetical protein
MAAPRKGGSKAPAAPTLPVTGQVGKHGAIGRSLTVELKVLTKSEVLKLIAEFGDDQGFFVHHVHGSMVSLTISPTRGGND